MLYTSKTYRFRNVYCNHGKRCTMQIVTRRKLAQTMKEKAILHTRQENLGKFLHRQATRHTGQCTLLGAPERGETYLC